MEIDPKSRMLWSYSKDIDKEKFNMKHPLQRKTGQWNLLRKSELIDSFLRGDYIDAVRCELKEDGIKYVFDGIQRSTTVNAFFSNKFKLSKHLPPVEIDGKEYEIAGKKFDDLDDEVQEKLKNCVITICTYSNCTPDDIRRMYFRQNNGVPLNNTQKRTAIESEKVSQIVFDLAEHEFFDKALSPAQLRKDLPRDLIRETLMLINTNEENDFTSFRAKDIDKFVVWYDENLSTEDISALTEVLVSLDSMDGLKIKSTSIPMILYSGYRCIKEGKDFRKFEAAVNEFVETYDTNEEYTQLVQSGTTSSAGVKARLQYWNNVVENL